MHHAPVHEIVLDEISVRFYPQKRIEIHYPKEFEITMETARQMDKHILKHVGTESFRLLINFENSFGNMPQDVQRYFAKEAMSIPQIEKSAIVLNSLGIRILVKFYMNFFKPKYPTQIFGSLTEARVW